MLNLFVHFSNGGLNQQSGDDFENYVQTDGMKELFRITQLDFDWFEECQRENAKLTLNGVAWLDQSNTSWSQHCLQLGKPNLRAEFGCMITIFFKF